MHMSDRKPYLLRPEHALLHPVWLVSLVLLLVNDHVLKGAGLIHSAATGKISDIVGLVVAPALLATLLRVGSRRGLAACHLATGAVFALIQISPAFASLVESGMAAVGIPWRIWPDLTDLLALPALLVSWRVLEPAMRAPLQGRRRMRQLGQLGAVTVGLVACLGTSKAKEPVAPAQPQPEQMVAAQPAQARFGYATLAGHRWEASNAKGTWRLSYHFREDGSYTAAGQPAWHEAGQAQVVRVEGNLMVLRLSKRTFDGQADEDIERELVLAADGKSFTLGEDTFRRHDSVASIALEDDDEDR